MQESVIIIYNNYILYGWQKFLTTEIRHCDKECELSHKSLNPIDDCNFQFTPPSVYLQYKIIQKSGNMWKIFQNFIYS
jgi:hypothetical protein